MSLERAFYTLEEMAELLHKKPWTLYKETSRAGRGHAVDLPPFIKIGNRILFPVDAFNEWVKEQLNGQVRMPKRKVSQGN